MRVYDTYELGRVGNSEIAALGTERSGRPGWGSRLAFLFAFLFVGLCAWAWNNNDSIVAWGLSQGLVGEAATRTLPGAVRVASVAGGVLGLIAAGLSMRLVRLAVTRVLGYMGLSISRVSRPMLLGISAFTQLATLVLKQAWLGVATAGRSIGQPAGLGLRYLQVGASAVLRHQWLGASIVALAAGLGLHYMWMGVSPVLGYVHLGIVAVAVGLSMLHGYVWLGVSAALRCMRGVVVAVAHAVTRTLRYLWVKVSLAYGYMGRGVSISAQVVGLALRYLWVGVSITAQVAGLALRYLWVRVSITARVAGLALGYLWVKVSLAYGYMGRGVSITAQVVGLALRYLGMVVSAALGCLRRGVSITAQVAGMGLRYLWVGVSVTAQVAGMGLRYLWVGVSITAQVAGMGLRHLWVGVFITAQVVGLALRYLWVRVSAALGYLLRGVAITAQVAGLALRYLWVGVSTALGHLWRGVAIVAQAAGLALRYLGVGVSAALGHLWRGVAIVAEAVSVALRYLGVGVSAALGHLWRGVAIVAEAVSVALRYLGMVVSAALGHLWRGVSIVAQAVSLALRYLGMVVSAALRYLWRGASMVAQVAGLARRYLWVGVSAALGYLWLGVSAALGYLWLGVLTVSPVAGLALRYLWMGVSAALGYLWEDVSILVQVAGLALRYLWMGVSAALGYLLRGVSIVAQVAGLALRYLWMGVSAVLGHLWLGVLTVALVLGWALHHIWQGSLIILQGLKRTPVFVVRTVWTAITDLPDVLRAVVWVVKHRKGVSDMSDHDLTRERLVSLVVTALVFFTIAAIGVRVFWPAPPEPRVVVTHWVTGHLYFGPNLPGMATQFNDTGPRTKSGKPIVVEIHNAPSSEGARDLLSRVTGRGPVQQDLGGRKRHLPDPTIVTPSGAHWLVGVNHQAGYMAVNPDAARSIARAYVGIVTYREMAECLGWPEKELGFADIIELRADPRGWEKYDCADPFWGKQPLVAYTDPRTSSTGRSVLLSLYAIAADKLPEELEIDDVYDPNVVGYVKGFQELIDHYLIGTTVLNTKIYQGPRYGHFFIVPEDSLIHLKDGTARAIVGMKKVTAPAIEDEMVMIYPKEGSMVRNNCACIVNADWVTEEQVEAAEMWIDFMLEDEQQRVFMGSGFRPTAGLPLDDPSSKVTSEFGLDMTKPTKELNPALIAPEVAAEIDRSWEETVKRQGIVAFVVDTSGSMMGTKLQQTKDGMNRALEAMAKNNQLGFLTFNDTVKTTIPVAPLDGNGYLINEAVHKMRARGETALYDAIKKGIEMTDAAEGDENAIRAVVVLTDGRANRCQTRLDELIQMESKTERPIGRFGGCEGDPPAEDNRGASVADVDVIGTGLAIETVHDIQVFFIGIGEDADLEVGRILAEATGAEFQGVTEEDLAALLEEFSGYF